MERKVILELNRVYQGDSIFCLNLDANLSKADALGVNNRLLVTRYKEP